MKSFATRNKEVGDQADQECYGEEQYGSQNKPNQNCNNKPGPCGNDDCRSERYPQTQNDCIAREVLTHG